MVGLWAIAFGARGKQAWDSNTLPAAGFVTPPGAVPTPAQTLSKTAAAKPVSANRVSRPVCFQFNFENRVEHKFAEAHLLIWVDDRLSYTHLLSRTDKKHLVLFHHVQGHEFHEMRLPAGNHRLRVRVTSGAVLSDQSATVAGDFASGRQNVLRVNFNNRGEMSVSLR